MGVLGVMFPNLKIVFIARYPKIVVEAKALRLGHVIQLWIG